MERALEIAKTEALKTGRPKNKPELKKLRSEWVRGLQTAQKTTKEKSWVEDDPGKKCEKSHSEERKEPYIRESSYIK